MRIYELRSQMPKGTIRSFYGSSLAAKSARTGQVGAGIPRKYHEILTHDVPTGKTGLLDWLNENAGRIGYSESREAASF